MTGQDKTGEDKTRQDDRTRQDRRRQDEPRQDRTRQDKTRQDKTRQDKKRQDKTRQDRKRQDKTRQDKTRQDKTRQWRWVLKNIRKVNIYECECIPGAVSKPPFLAFRAPSHNSHLLPVLSPSSRFARRRPFAGACRWMGRRRCSVPTQIVPRTRLSFVSLAARRVASRKTRRRQHRVHHHFLNRHFLNHHFLNHHFSNHHFSNWDAAGCCALFAATRKPARLYARCRQSVWLQAFESREKGGRGERGGELLSSR